MPAKSSRPICTISTSTSISTQSICPGTKLSMDHMLLESVSPNLQLITPIYLTSRLNKKWMEYQGIKNWEGLLDPLDDNLRAEIIRYGQFVESSYQAFDFDQSSPLYGLCRYPKSSLLERSRFPNTGYRVTKHLHVTSGVQLLRWMEKGTSWVGPRSSWIGYMAVCTNKDEIARLGRRDIVITYRGTATCLEWLENLRSTLTPVSSSGHNHCDPMVESGFLSLYNSGNKSCLSLQNSVKEEVNRILQMYGNEPLSLTISGHSLGAALATLTAYYIKSTFKNAPLVTVISFGGPRVGNWSFRCQLEKQGTKILRILNSNDLITKVPGFVIDNNKVVHTRYSTKITSFSSWIQKLVKDTPWVYSEVGCEFRLNSQNSPYLNGINIAKCHDLKTYLHLVNGFVSSKCPFNKEVLERGKNNVLVRSKVKLFT